MLQAAYVQLSEAMRDRSAMRTQLAQVSAVARSRVCNTLHNLHCTHLLVLCRPACSRRLLAYADSDLLCWP